MTLSGTEEGVRGLGYVTYVCVSVAICSVPLHYYRAHTLSTESNWKFILAKVAGMHYVSTRLYERNEPTALLSMC